MFWFAPGWSSTNAGGTGPGEWGRLIEVGSYTPDSSYGWWSIYVDDGGNNLYFSAQTNDFSSNVWTYLSRAHFLDHQPMASFGDHLLVHEFGALY